MLLLIIHAFLTHVYPYSPTGSLQREKEKRRKKAADDARISAARERNKSKYRKKDSKGKNQTSPATALSIKSISTDGKPETEEKHEEKLTVIRACANHTDMV